VIHIVYCVHLLFPSLLREFWNMEHDTELSTSYLSTKQAQCWCNSCSRLGKCEYDYWSFGLYHNADYS